MGNRKLPQTKLAAQTGISYKVLNDILNCRRPLTTSTALLFEAALGISAGLLMRMQLDYNMQLAESDQTLMERCLLYTSDAADDLLCGVLGGRRIIKQKIYTPICYTQLKIPKKPYR